MKIKSSSHNIKAGMVKAKPSRGFVLLEIVIALGFLLRLQFPSSRHCI